MKGVRGLPLGRPGVKGEGGQPKEDLLYIPYKEQRRKTAVKRGRGVNCRPKIVDVLCGRPLLRRKGLVFKMKFDDVTAEMARQEQHWKAMIWQKQFLAPAVASRDLKSA